VAALIAKTHELVAEHWESIELVAEALSEYGTLQAADIEALLDPTPDRVKLTKQQRQAIVAWAEQVRLVEAVRLFGSRAKGFARRGSDVDLAVTATDGNYTRFDKDWQTALALALALALDMKVRLSQYNVTGDDIVRDYCDTFCVKLFERPAEAGFKRPSGSRGQSR
jgi:predicted nucleotidyltransferase